MFDPQLYGVISGLLRHTAKIDLFSLGFNHETYIDSLLTKPQAHWQTIGWINKWSGAHYGLLLVISQQPLLVFLATCFSCSETEDIEQ
jgi:hypothetical protein